MNTHTLFLSLEFRLWSSLTIEKPSRSTDESWATSISQLSVKQARLLIVREALSTGPQLFHLIPQTLMLPSATNGSVG